MLILANHTGVIYLTRNVIYGQYARPYYVCCRCFLQPHFEFLLSTIARDVGDRLAQVRDSTEDRFRFFLF